MTERAFTQADNVRRIRNYTLETLKALEQKPDFNVVSENHFVAAATETAHLHGLFNASVGGEEEAFAPILSEMLAVDARLRKAVLQAVREKEAILSRIFSKL